MRTAYNMMERRRRSISLRRKSARKELIVGLDAQHLEDTIVNLAKFSQDQELAELSNELYRGFAERQKKLSRWIVSELCEMTNTLVLLLESSRSEAVPPSLVAQMHSCVGLIRMQQEHFKLAIRSFLQALWIQSSLEDTDCTALTEHRLGLAYGEAGDHEQAISLLNKALQSYDRAQNVEEDDACVLKAKASLKRFKKAHLDSRPSYRVAFGAKRNSRVMLDSKAWSMRIIHEDSLEFRIT